MYVDSKMKNILVLGEDPTQGLYNVTTTVEDKYPVNFTESLERFVLSLYYKGSNSFLFINPTNISIQRKRFRNKTISIMIR